MSRERKEYGLHDVLEFGRYQGVTLMEVARTDTQYIHWCLDNVWHFDIDQEASDWIEALERNVNRSMRY